LFCLFVCLFDVRNPVAILDRARSTVASSRW
jgi:hypothetical protein